MPYRRNNLEPHLRNTMPQSNLEQTFATSIRLLNIEPPEREYAFCPGRKWRFDFAWPKYKVAVEIQGGTFSNGRHTRGNSLHLEYDKSNNAAKLGWRILYFDTKHLKNPVECVFMAVESFTTGEENE